MSHKCPACNRLNFSDAAACHHCGASLGEAAPRWQPRADAFHKQTASFNDDWRSSSAPSASAPPPPRSILAGTGAIRPSSTTDNLIRVLVMCILLLLSIMFGREHTESEKRMLREQERKKANIDRSYDSLYRDLQRGRPRYRTYDE